MTSNDAMLRRRFHRSALVAVLATTALSACTEQLRDDTLVSADIRSNDSRALTALQLVIRDSSLVSGDTATVSASRGSRVLRNTLLAIAVRFRSSDTTVISVDRLGMVHALRQGSASITARSVIGGGKVELTVAAQGGPPVDPPVTPESPPPAEPPATLPPATLPPGTQPSFAIPQLPAEMTGVYSIDPVQRSIAVPAGDEEALQRALDTAVDGDEIVLPDGAVYTGTFTLPRRAGNGTVVLRSATVPVAARARMTPSSSARLASLVTTSVAPALTTAPGARGWRIVAVALRLADGAVDNYGIVTLGSGTETSASAFPQHIVLDRVLVMGSTTGNTSRCVAMNGIQLAVVDSWLAECHARGRDAQAIGAWTGSGPLLIENNHLAGSGQAVMIGGADPRISGLTPSDITIRRNHLFKPLAWANGRWTVKAAFELKNAERVLFEGNVIENHWADAQSGFAILFQAANQDGGAPWSTIRDVTVRLNAVRNATSGFNLLSRLDAGGQVVQPSRRILLRDNSFESVGRDPVRGVPGRFLQLMGDHSDVTLIQNTFFGRDASNDLVLDGVPSTRLLLASNVFASATYGIIGSGVGEGSASLARYSPGGTALGNVLTGLHEVAYPPGNLFPVALSESDFVAAGSGNFTLRPEAGIRSRDGGRLGVDGTAVLGATRDVTRQ